MVRAIGGATSGGACRAGWWWVWGLWSLWGLRAERGVAPAP